MSPQTHLKRSPQARWLALASLVLGAVALILAVIAVVSHFPRGLLVLVLIGIAIAAGWDALLRLGTPRIIGLAVAAVALIGSVLLLVSQDLLLVVVIVVAAIGAVLCARRAITARVELPRARAPERPVLIYNPKSGGGKATRFKLADEARRRGIEPVELTFEIPIIELVEDLVAEGYDGLAVAGGDGTQALVAEIAAREGLPYACIPAGTRNHFALDLGVDRDDVVGALDAFVDGGERIVDLGEVNGRVFVNNVSLGVYGDAVQQAGYRDAKIRTLLDTLPADAAAREGGRREQSADPDGSDQSSGLRWHGPDGISRGGGLALLISNNVYRLGRLVGSGTRPRMDAGVLGVAVIEPPTAGRTPLRNLTRTTVEVEGRDQIAAGIDGEAVMLDAPVRFSVRPGALRVRIAPQHPGCSPSAGLPSSPWQGVGLIARIAMGTDG